METFMGKEVSKETIAFGIGGEIRRESVDGFAETEAPQRVVIEAEVDYRAVKGKFLDDGTVHVIDILTIDKNTVRVVKTGLPVGGEKEIEGQEQMLGPDGDDDGLD